MYNFDDIDQYTAHCIKGVIMLLVDFCLFHAYMSPSLKKSV